MEQWTQTSQRLASRSTQYGSAKTVGSPVHHGLIQIPIETTSVSSSSVTTHKRHDHVQRSQQSIESKDDSNPVAVTPRGFRGHAAIKSEPQKKKHRAKTTSVIDTSLLKREYRLSAEFGNGYSQSKKECGLAVSGDRLRVAAVNRPQPHRPTNTRALGGLPSAKSEGFKTPTARGTHCDACALEQVRYWLKEQGTTRKKPPSADEDEIDLGEENIRAFHQPLQLLKDNRNKEHQQIFLLAPGTAKSPMADQPVRPLPTVSVPKKGLIKLTGLAYELDNPDYFDSRKELEEQRDQLRYHEELMGPALPSPSPDLQRGWLIKDRRIMQQIKQGIDQLHREQAELTEKQTNEHALLTTMVGGLLTYEMPEVPTLNNHLQRFVGERTSQPDTRTQPASHTKARRQKSKSALPAYALTNFVSNNNNRYSPTKSESATPNHSQIAYSNYMTSPRQAFVSTSPGEDSNSDLLSFLLPCQDEPKPSEEDPDISLHQLVSNAQHYHLPSKVINNRQYRASVLPVLQ